MLDLQISSQERHDRFVRRVAKAREVWGLKCADGWACSVSTTEAGQGRNVMPFWSDRAYAGQCSVKDWSRYEPTSIPLDMFLNRWLTGMAADGLLVGTNWSAHLCGHEIEPAELRSVIEKQIE